MSGGWAQVPEAIMEAMLKQVVLADYIRFGAVCVSWRSVTLKRTMGPRMQLPWLMAKDSPEADSIRFFSPSEKRYYNLKLPKPAYCWGAYEGWLMIELLGKCRKNCLFNPTTGEEIRIPCLSTLPYSVKNQRTSIQMAILSSVPAVLSDLDVACLYNEGNLALCTPGGRKWYAGGNKETNYVAIMFHDECLHALDERVELSRASHINRTGITSLMKLTTRLPPDSITFRRTLYLTENINGSILMVAKEWMDEMVEFRMQRVVRRFRVFELHEIYSTWGLVNNFGEYILVLGSGYAKFFSAAGTSGAIAGRIYSTEEIQKLSGATVTCYTPYQDCWLYVYNYEHFSRRLYFEGPSAEQCHFPHPPIWFTPNAWQRLEESPTSSLIFGALENLCYPLGCLC